MKIHWHRRDLRTADNCGLTEAAGSGSVLPVFVFDDAVLQHGSPPRVAYMLDALDSLRESYREHGSDLLVTRGDPRTVLSRLAETTDAEAVVWNKDYSGLARERDTEVRRALDEVDVARESYHDAICHEPGSITTNDGDPYSVFTYFGRKWLDREKEAPYEAPNMDDLADPASHSVPDRWSTSLPTLGDLGFDEPEADLQSASTDAARERLDDFCAGDIYRYDERRDYPADDATSRLSADLKWGTMGIRTVYAATAEAMERADTDAEAESVEEFQSQLAWREFYSHVLFFNPEVVSENYKEYENPIEWRDESEHLAAWKAGETGYPIVDAGMRQLLAEGYMHNRVRMIVASFLAKDLLIDWREGYNWFREKLVDHETANDNGGWQWAASTGTDSQPYFRIFNPMTQGERYDPDATYIKRYVPELEEVEAEQIHAWHELSATQRRRLAPEYPDPIVEHSQRREAALEMFETARGE